MPLRSICSYLARKPSSIDVMLLFIKPAEILEPLCDLLDTWRYEEDQGKYILLPRRFTHADIPQGEYQPVYEEFGYILLLVLTFVFRYSFTSSDLAFSHQPNNEAFVPQLLYEFSTAHRIEALNSSEFHGQLGGWIKELFEGEGISDGLMSSCRPQEFYRIVPTLFSQSMLAIQRGILDLDTVKEAFAFLLTPFLLPSVISGLSWLSQHLWANLDDPYHTLQILSSLIIAQDLAPETAETHRTVVSISARRLDATLRELLRRPNISRDTVRTAQQLLNYLKPHLAFKRNGSPARNEIDSWVHNAGSGGLSTALANLYSVMFLWSLPGDMAQVRPQTSAYTHRLIMSTWKLLGAYRVVEVIINETVKARLSQQAPPGIAEDVAAAFVGVYLPFEKGGPWTLKEALRSMDLFEEDPGRAEVVADVLRRVEALGRPWVPADHGGVGMEDAAAHHHVDLGSMGLGPEDGMDLMMGGEDFGSGLGMLDAMEM